MEIIKNDSTERQCWWGKSYMLNMCDPACKNQAKVIKTNSEKKFDFLH